MVGIIPKPIKKASKIYRFSPQIAFGLVIAVVLVYVALFYLEKKSSATLRGVEDSIAQVGTQDEKVLEAQVLLDKQRIDDFAKLFANHRRTSNLFKFLEENCHPKVWFNELALRTEDAQVTLTGETSSFKTLGQQMVIFQNQALVKNIELSDFAIGKSGLVNFGLSLLLDPEIFKNHE